MTNYNRTRIGASVGLFAVFCVLMLEVFRGTRQYELYRWHACGALLGLGAVLWLIGRRRNAGAGARVAEEDPADSSAEEEKAAPFVLFDLTYWGEMLLLCGLTVPLIVPDAAVPKPVQARALEVRSNAPAPPTNIVVPIPSRQPPPFPSLKLQGVTYRPPKSSVIINRRTWFVGESVEGVTIVSINSASVIVEFCGERKVLTFDR